MTCGTSQPTSQRSVLPRHVFNSPTRNDGRLGWLGRGIRTGNLGSDCTRQPAPPTALPRDPLFLFGPLFSRVMGFHHQVHWRRRKCSFSSTHCDLWRPRKGRHSCDRSHRTGPESVNQCEEFKYVEYGHNSVLVPWRVSFSERLETLLHYLLTWWCPIATKKLPDGD